MRSILAQAGEAPAPRLRTRGRVLRFDPRCADPRGWRLAELVAGERGIPIEALFYPERCTADVALARQLAMYLMHVAFGRLYADVGRFFGRDRTTVSHACAVIEELREAPEFEEIVARLEAALADATEAERETADATA
ncbi:MAG: DNA-binding protein [Devosia sp.]|uniref:helix-turn-helix domain-containing protein n=1 Tax=Devosia sp. TaxID=1871048 RepID=UPI0026193848|nr:helix-turn-helix domain-containing protein [Devosia sp.]MDB5542425.1 DNA-binding protein [Devosia sp.]